MRPCYLWLAVLAGAVLSHGATPQATTVLALVGYFATLVVQRVRERRERKMEFSERMYDGR